MEDDENSQSTQVVSMSTPSILQCAPVGFPYPGMVLQCVAVCSSVLQCVALCCSVLQCVAVCCSVLQCIALCCSVFDCDVLLFTQSIIQRAAVDFAYPR